MERAGRAVVERDRVGVEAAGREVSESIRRRLDRDVPGRSLRSGAKSGRSTGKAMSVRLSSLKRIPENPAVLITARGPWQVIERPTKAHMIMSKGLRRDIGRSLVGLGGARSKRSGSKGSRVLSFGPGQVARYARHPGTRGMRTFELGARAGEKRGQAAFVKEWRRTLSGVLR